MAEHTRLLTGDAEARLSAGEVRETVFPSVRFGGLNAELVTRFMRRVTAELDTLAGERADCEDEILQLRQELFELRSRPVPAPANGSYLPGLPPVEQQAVHILRRAQESADNLVHNAGGQARNIVEDARQQRERMLADGHVQRQRAVQQGIEEAGREAARIAAQAPLDAQRMLAQYRGLAESVRAGLNANLRALSDTVAAWEAQERQGPVPPVPGRQTGPQPVPVQPLA